MVMTAIGVALVPRPSQGDHRPCAGVSDLIYSHG
jgi:hypothetical protein